ncbi:M1 family metallopeptidase [Modestobacter sp. NPDC049651]|uniref:M1 family metallopeptidase n=1 Tax=unclassified Modestobacter TaxID=2643866 RepID=UPI0033F595EB
MLASTVALAGILPLVAATPAVAAPAPGSTSGGDPYFPAAGNGGYDVRHYGLGLAYEPGTGRLDGTAVITLTATTDLSSFSLDLRGLAVAKVLVDGRKAAFTQTSAADGRGGELVVQARLAARSTHRVTVVYGGVPGRPTDIGGELYGWVSTPDGALVANEPEGASTWFPVNDVPGDKATYDFVISVPAGKTAVANGELVGRPVTAHGRTVWTWHAKDPMASYLATASIGDFELTTQTGPRGLPINDFVDRDLAGDERATAQASLAQEPEMVAFLETVYGRYPFTSFGSIVDDDSVGYALETQTKPVYSGAPDASTVLHELAHQWVGDSVTPARWADIWLNEGLATFSEWLWAEHTGTGRLQESFDAVMATPADDEFWQVAPADPGAADLFADATYNRGAAALYALRGEIGEQAFGTLLRRWATEHRYGTVTTADFTALAERVSHRDLDDFFRTWLYTPAKPTTW